MVDYLEFKIKRGADDSADESDLTFNINSVGLEGGSLILKVKFNNPLLVSTGSRKDKMLAMIMNGKFFTPPNTACSVPNGYSF